MDGLILGTGLGDWLGTAIGTGEALGTGVATQSVGLGLGTGTGEAVDRGTGVGRPHWAGSVIGTGRGFWPPLAVLVGTGFCVAPSDVLLGTGVATGLLVLADSDDVSELVAVAELCALAWSAAALPVPPAVHPPHSRARPTTTPAARTAKTAVARVRTRVESMHSS